MNKLVNKLGIIAAVAGLSVQVANGQSPSLTGNQTYETVSDKQVSIMKPTKISDKIQTIDSIVPIPPITYSILKKQVETNFEVDPIRAASLKIVEKLPKLYQGYVRAGIGNNTTPLLDAYYNANRSKKGGYGFRARHFSSNGGVPDAGFSGFSHNSLSLFGKKFLRDHTLTGSVDYKRDVNHFYGYDVLKDTFERDSIKQRFNYIAASAEYASYFKDSTDLNYDVKVKYYNYNDFYGAKENNVVVGTTLSKYFNKELFTLDAFVDFNNYQAAEIFTRGNDVTQQVKTEAVNNVILKLHPQITSRGKNYEINVGLGIYGDIDNTARFHFYPKAQAKYSLFNDIFIPYAGITGEKRRNSFRSLSQANPWVLSNLNLQNSNHAYELYGGIRGTLSSKTAFNLRVAQNKVRDLALFVNDTLYSVENQFGVAYDTVDYFNFSAELLFHQSDKLQVQLRGDYWSYKTERELEAWHLPNYRVGITGTYDLRDKILVRADVFAIGERKARSLNAIDGIDPVDGVTTVNLKGYVDANLGFEYRYTKRLSAFLNFNNIASQKYQQWYRYRVQGFNVLGGVTYAF